MPERTFQKMENSGPTDPNPKYLHNSIAPIRIFEHWSGANKYVEIEGSDPLYYTAFY